MFARKVNRTAAWVITALLAGLQGGTASAAAPSAGWRALAPAMFEHLVPAERGFPSPITMSVVQDGDGFIWFGTQSGLGRWDGYRMRNFFFNAADPKSLPGDFIQTLHVDRQGRLWVGTTTDGLAMYDRHTEQFVRFPAGPNGLSSPAVGAIASYPSGGIWVGTAAGLDYIDTAHANTITHHPRKAGPSSNQIRSLLVDQHGDLWIGSNGGLARRDGATGKITDLAVADAVLSLAANARGDIVFGTAKSGIGRAGVIHNVAQARLLEFDRVPDPGNAMVLSLAEVGADQWWAATYGGGIIEFDLAGHGRRINHRPAAPVSLAHDRVAALWRDRSGLLWVANERGVDIFNPANRTFDNILDGEGLLEVSASAFMTDSAGRLWVALGDQGIDLISAAGVRTRGLRPDPAQPDTALPQRMILSLTEAEPQEAWIGTLLGLYHTSAQGSKVRRVPLPQGEPFPRIGSIVSMDNILWLGTPGGLLRFDSAAGTVQNIGAGRAEEGKLSDSRITTMLKDPDGAIWVGTRNGLNRFDPASGKVEHILAAPERSTALPQGFVNSLAFDQRGRLWVGTNSGGFGVLDGRTGDGARRFLRVAPPPGAPTMAVNGIRADQAGRMWASTNRGIVVVDAATLRLQVLGRGDGLLLQAYYGGAVGTTAQSDIVFGTSGAYVVVHPAMLSRWQYQPPLAVTAVHLDQVATPAAPLLGPGSRGLSIAAGVRKLEVEVAALDYSASQRNRYAFWLEGYDKDWVETESSQRIATYANVPPGRYRLHMRGSNRDGTWSPHEQVMVLQFQPAWYQTWWARLASGMAVLVLGWGLYRWRVRQLRHTQVLLQQQVFARTLHLERVNAIVKTINEELDFDALLRTILRASGDIGQIRAAYALICEHSDDQLAVRASWQHGAHALGQGMPLAEAQACLVNGADCVAPDMFLSGKGHVLTVRICVEQQVRGFLVFEHEGPFGANDLELFKALKEPFVSAFQKAHAIGAIQLARTAAEASARAKSEFLANISHEIRTPMNAILGFADLGRHLELAAKPRDYFGKISRAGQNLLSIIDDVLDFSKIESGKLRLESVPFSLREMLAQIADLFSLRAAEKGLELVVWADPDVPVQVVGDPLRLSQVLVNLVGNALKFTAQGHLVLHVDVQRPHLPESGRVQLRFMVEDSGVGISAEQQDHLFQAFSQADSSTTRLYGGTGLGLAISQQLVQAMGGMIQVDSRLEHGSRFHFALDLACGGGAPQTPEQLPAAVRGRQVLVVAADGPLQVMLAQLLHSMGLVAQVVPSSRAAQAYLQQAAVDVILTDCGSSAIDGIELARALQADPAQAAVPVVLMMTELTHEPLVLMAQQAGISISVSKPIDPEKLRHALLCALGCEAPALPEATGEASGLPDSAVALRGTRVLVVDDNVINQQVAREVLQQAGVQVDLASSGAEAVTLVELGGFDAVLMDIQMPGMDGYEATARIRAMPVGAKLPIIAMTAHAVAGFRESSMAMGMNDYVTKPIEAQRLFAVLANRIARNSGLPGEPDVPDAEMVEQPAMQGIDMSTVLKRLGNNQHLLRELLEKFVGEFEPAPAQLLTAIREGQYQAAALLVHKVRGAAGNLSMPELHRSAGELEMALLSPQLGQFDASLAAFSVALECVSDSIYRLEGVQRRPPAPVVP